MAMLNAFSLVRLGIYVHMADAVQVLITGTRASLLMRSIRAATARHDYIHVVRHADEGSYGGAVGGVDYLHHRLRQGPPPPNPGRCR